MIQKIVSTWNVLIIIVATTILSLTASEVHAHPPVVSKHYAYNSGSGNFAGLKATYIVPSIDPEIFGSSNCINHPMWIRYPDGAWVEIGIAKCATDPAGKYHLYGFALPIAGTGYWSPFADEVNLGSTVNLELRKINSTTWGFYVNSILRWQVSHSNFDRATSIAQMGLEVASPSFRPSTARASNIQFLPAAFPNWMTWSAWNPNLEDSTPEGYYIGKVNNNAYDIQTWGYGLPTVTGWGGANTFQLGQKNMGKTRPLESREAEDYSGISHIDAINWKTAANGEQAIFAMGWHQGDKAEYIIEIPSNPFNLCIILISDKPGPILLNIYVDNVYRGQMNYWAENDNNRHVWCQAFNIGGLKVSHVHAIGVEFANDYYAGPGDNDRNFYLDVLGVAP